MRAGFWCYRRFIDEFIRHPRHLDCMNTNIGTLSAFCAFSLYYCNYRPVKLPCASIAFSIYTRLHTETGLYDRWTDLLSLFFSDILLSARSEIGEASLILLSSGLTKRQNTTIGYQHKTQHYYSDLGNHDEFNAVMTG